jgi:hypothetical protein
MALTTSISTKELQRVAAAAYETRTLKVMLCQVALTNYTAENTVANWQSAEVSGNGYVRYSVVIGVGTYSSGDGRYNLPTVDAAFTATGVGYSYDRIVLYIDGATYPHSVITENPNIVLSSGQVQTYRLNLNCDD